MAESKEEDEEFFSYCSDMWTLGVIGMMRNKELYHTFLGGCSTVELLHDGTL
jgi:hypothetical protein